MGQKASQENPDGQWRGWSLSGGKLSHEVATAIALLWRKTLQGRVRLEGEGIQCSNVIPSYEWVVIDFPDPPRYRRLTVQLAAIARAQMIIWRYLASCPGFGAAENPIFWKEVLDALQTPPDDIAKRLKDSYTSSPRINDGTRFFTATPREFPRVRLAIPGAIASTATQHLFDAFFGLTKVNVDADSLVEHLIAQLSPLSKVPIEHQLLPVGLSLDVCPSLGMHLSRILSAVQSSDPVQMSAPIRFIVRSLWLRGSFSISNDDDVAGLTAITAIPSVDLRELVISPTVSISRKVVGDLLRSIMAVHPSADSKVRFLRLPPSGMPLWTVEAVSSGAPHTTSLARIAYDANQLSDLAWLGYGLFHPSVSLSSCREAFIHFDQLTDQAVCILEDMASGNRLRKHTAGEEDHKSTRYFSTLLPRTTPVRTHPTLTSDLLLSTDCDTLVDLCVRSGDTSTFGDWVCVVVPCYGCGWVQSTSVTAISANAPATSQLTSLTLASREPPESSALRRLIKLLGQPLKYLDLSGVGEVDADALRSILALCPSLRSLRVRHDGSLWGAPSNPHEHAIAAAPVPCLRELELFVGRNTYKAPTDAYINNELKDLVGLRVWSSEVAGAARSEVTDLLRRHISVEYAYLSWSAPRTGIRVRLLPLTYTTERERSRRSLGFLGDVDTFAHPKLPLQHRLAFFYKLLLAGDFRNQSECPRTV